MTESVDPAERGIYELLQDRSFRIALRTGEQRGCALPEELYQECGRRGLFALSVPADHGGLGLPLAARVGVHESIAAISPSLQSVLTAHEMAVYAIARFGCAELAARWLPEMAGGERPGAFALTEPSGGSDYAQIHTVATTTSDGIRLDGTKSWISSGMRAGIIIAFADSHAGPVAVCLPGDTSGLNRIAAPAVNALGAASIAMLQLAGCMVEPQYRLGAAGLGLIRVATGCLAVGRVLVAAAAVGVATAAMSALVAHANGRIVGAAPLAASPLVWREVANGHVGICAARMLTSHAAQAVDARTPEAAQHAIAAKLAAVAAAQTVTADNVRLHGAAGLMSDSPVLGYAAAAQVYAIIEGSGEALTSALGKTLLRCGPYNGVDCAT